MKLIDKYKNYPGQYHVGILYVDCPFCECSDIKKGISENYGETIEVNCLCNECEKEWNEIYNFSMSISV